MNLDWREDHGNALLPLGRSGLFLTTHLSWLVVRRLGFYRKRHVAKGDYQQTSGKRSEKRIPTGKLFGLRKFDLVECLKGFGFVKGKRSSGYFAIATLDGQSIHASANVKQCERKSARSTTLIEPFHAAPPHG
jgi:hypothetical protein